MIALVKETRFENLLRTSIVENEREVLIFFYQNLAKDGHVFCFAETEEYGGHHNDISGEKNHRKQIRLFFTQ